MLYHLRPNNKILYFGKSIEIKKALFKTQKHIILSLWCCFFLFFIFVLCFFVFCCEIFNNVVCLQVKLGKLIGLGDFGRVLQAEARKLVPGHKKTSVVVKQLKATATKEEKEEFLRPVDAMK